VENLFWGAVNYFGSWFGSDSSNNQPAVQNSVSQNKRPWKVDGMSTLEVDLWKSVDPFCDNQRSCETQLNLLMDFAKNTKFIKGQSKFHPQLRSALDRDIKLVFDFTFITNFKGSSRLYGQYQEPYRGRNGWVKEQITIFSIGAFTKFDFVDSFFHEMWHAAGYNHRLRGVECGKFSACYKEYDRQYRKQRDIFMNGYFKGGAANNFGIWSK